MQHNFTDGMALGSAFLLHGSVGGWSRTLFLLAHELPQEVSFLLKLTEVSNLSRSFILVILVLYILVHGAVMFCCLAILHSIS